MKVVIGMSGGVDSSVSAYLLKKRGYSVVGITMIQDDNISRELSTCREICQKLGIEHKIVDVRENFKNKIINYFLNSYQNGITPSPCVICDDEIKFKTLFEVADKIGAQFVATGHYAKIVKNTEFGKFLITKSKNIRKDQGYMLSRITSDKLTRIIFPLENYEKSEIREIAKNLGLKVHDKKDSQGICFAPNGYLDFLEKNLKCEKGNFIDKNGLILGTHKGYIYYTVGQRRGLGIKLPRAYFITKINPKTNEITLGEYDDLKIKKIELKKYVAHIELKNLENKILIGRPRFSNLGEEGKIYSQDGKIYFEYTNYNPYNTRGQHMVIYYNDFIVGSGIIDF